MIFFRQVSSIPFCSVKYLQLAGVHCEGKPSFWLSADGKYQEEGQKNEYGPIWDKVHLGIWIPALA